MRRLPRLFLPQLLTLMFFALVGVVGCASKPPTRPAATGAVVPAIAIDGPLGRPTAPGQLAPIYPVMLGIDVLEQQNFALLQGKRVGLLTHSAGVNRKGESTMQVLQRAPGVKLVSLFGMEHGLRGEIPAERTYPDYVDKQSGLKVRSLYNGKSRKPTKAQLSDLDVVVVDLQDIGTRSYTFISAMRLVMEGCFEQGKEVVVLDRPNPLGGLKVDGPMLDPQWKSYVGAFPTPYVHGLTIGELARWAKDQPGILEVPDAVRQRGKLTVVPMRGWMRFMRWPDTGLKWVPTSPYIQDYAAVMGYPMTGLGCYLGGFSHGVGSQYPFRGVSHNTVKIDVIERELQALRLPGLRFHRVSVANKNGAPRIGLFVEVIDWDEWRPTELSFYLMKLGCKLESKNPYTAAPQGQANGFLRHMGSTSFFEALKRDGAKVDVDLYIRTWQAQAQAYQQKVRQYWLY